MLTQNEFTANILKSLDNLNKVVQSLHEFAMNTHHSPEYKDYWDHNAGTIEETSQIIHNTKEFLMKKSLPKRTIDTLKGIQ